MDAVDKYLGSKYGVHLLWPAFSGVIVVEAQKRLYQGLPVASRASRRVFAPVLAPQGVPTTRSAP